MRGLLVDVGPLVLVLVAAGCNQARHDPGQPKALASTGEKHSSVLSSTRDRAKSAVSPLRGGSDCQRLCSVGSQLNCKATVEQCNEACSHMLSIERCQRELAVVFSCLIAAPSTHFECDDDGMPAIKDGFCDSEQGQFARCMQ